MVKVSVVIPVYNREKYVGECLDSVISQTLKELEIICIDDGSTDGSYGILMDYCSKYANIIVLHQENQGAGAARNRGIECARGKYICFMDSDDYYAQDTALEHLYKWAEENHASVCGGNLSIIWENGELQKSSKWFYERKKYLFKNYGYTFNYTAYIFSLKLIQKNNIKFSTYTRFEDPPFFLNVMACAQEFFAVDELVYIYRHGHKELQGSLNMAIDLLKGIRDCFEIAEKNNFIKMYDEYLKNILSIHLWIIYPYIAQKQIWVLIDQINKINMEWRGEYPEIFQDRNSLETYVTARQRERSHMISECRKADKVIIYGAGGAGRYFLENYGKECRHIAGFAVSRKDKEQMIAGYEVKEIGEYNRDVLVIVAVGERYLEEMLQNLERLKFEKVCCMNYTALQIIERI